MGRASSLHRISDDARVYSCADVIATLSVLSRYQIAAEQVLAPLDIDRDLMQDPTTRLSSTQLDQVLFRASQSCPDVLLPLLIGERLHITSYGSAGLALLSSETGATALGIAVRYAPLFNVRCALELKMSGEEVTLHLVASPERAHPCSPEIRLLDLSKILSLLRDIGAESLRPMQIRCRSKQPQMLTSLAEVWHCPVEGGAPADEIRFAAGALALPLKQAHAGTHDRSIASCEILMTRFSVREDVTDEVRKILLSARERLPALPEVAKQLCMSERTLRRRLKDLNTSFKEIIEEIAKDLAIRYITSGMTVEDVAERLGYSDAANFKHAFQRWTGMSPLQYCAARGHDRRAPRLSAPVTDRPHARARGFNDIIYRIWAG